MTVDDLFTYAIVQITIVWQHHSSKTTRSSALISNVRGITAALIDIGGATGGGQEAHLDLPIVQSGPCLAVFSGKLSSAATATLRATTAIRPVVALGCVDAALLLLDLDDGGILSFEAYPFLP
mmetsp:Transcript_20738/g.59444  ORF Transcript_20738/g.59444 Transcript_20738/m.59444 type:complete len:123 (-) Transcript_20738:973-1341(-)